MPRHDGRAATDLRPIKFEIDYLRHADGSVLVSFGHTRVLCAVTCEDKVPLFLKDTGEGWVTGEYGMLPASTSTRTPRDVGRPSGRTMEIQRLIGRALRSVTDRKALGLRTIWVDCDVLEADGGTRTASITGGFVAMALALSKLRDQKKVTRPIFTGMLAAVSVGLVASAPVLDLDYVEDSGAEVDMNVVRTDDGRYVEIQGTAETTPFRRDKLDELLALADAGIDRLLALQREALGDKLPPLLVKR
jgi:ribonuclease PH